MDPDPNPNPVESGLASNGKSDWDTDGHDADPQHCFNVQTSLLFKSFDCFPGKREMWAEFFFSRSLGTQFLVSNLDHRVHCLYRINVQIRGNKSVR